MAGQSVGTIFVELDLDPSRYTKGQQQLLKDATSTSLNIEENFKKLGVKSSAEMDLMRAKITNSFDMIANSSKATANDIMRAEEAKNAKLQALNEQQFGKQTSLLSNIKTHWLAYSAAAYGALATIQKGWTMAESAAGYVEQMQLLEGLAQKYNTSSTVIVSKIREIGEGMISMSTASQVGLSGLAKGLNPEMMYGLAKAATVLSDVMGVNANEAFIRLSESLESNKTKGLKLAVGVIDLKDKYGDLADKMSESEKQAALYNMIMEKTAEIQAQTGESIKSIADQMDTFKIRAADLRIELGIYLMKAGMGVIGLFEGMYSAGLMAAAGVWKLIEAKDRLKALFSWGGWKEEFLRDASIAASMAAENFDKSGKAATKAQNNFKLMLTSTEDLIKAEKNRSSAINTTTDSVGKREAAEKKAAGIALAQGKQSLDAMKSEHEQYLEARKMQIKMEYDNIKWVSDDQLEIVRKRLEDEETLAYEHYNFLMQEATKEADGLAKSEGEKFNSVDFWRKKRADAEKIYDKESMEAVIQANKAESEISTATYNAIVKRWTDQAKVRADYYKGGKTAEQEIKEAEESVNVQEAMYRDLFYKSGLYAKEYLAIREQQIDIETDKQMLAMAQRLSMANSNTGDMKKDIENLAQAEKQAMEEGIIINAAAAEKKRLLHLELNKAMLQYSDDFVKGWKVGLDEMQAKQETWGKAGLEMFNSFTGSTSSTFSTLFKDTITGHLKSFGDYFKSFWDTMLNKFMDILAQMLTEWLTLQAAMKASQWMGFSSFAPGATNNGQQVAGQVGTQVGTSMASKGLYNWLFGGSTAGGVIQGAGGLGAGGVGAGGMGGGAYTTSGSTTGAAVAAYAGPIAAAIAAQQLIQHGPEWLAAAMGHKGETTEQSVIRKMLMYPSEYSLTPLTAEQIGEPVFPLNPTELAQYQADMIAKSIEGTNYLKGLKESALYAQMAANPPEGFSSWAEYAGRMREQSDLGYVYTPTASQDIMSQVSPSDVLGRPVTMHDGGIIVAHQGRYIHPGGRALASDERLILGLTGERVLNREQTKEYDSGGNNGGEITLHNHLYIDGKEVTDTVVRGIRAGDDDLIKYIRRAVN